MKARPVFLSFLVAVWFSIAVSQTVGVNAAERSVSPVYCLSIEQSKYSGEWKGRDIAVEYSYSKDQGVMDISGKIRFAHFFMGYSRLQDFHMGVIFVDRNGKVLKEIGLAVNRGSFEPIAFTKRIDVPQNAVSMAFTYQGDAVTSGMGGSTSFSFYPAE